MENMAALCRALGQNTLSKINQFPKTLSGTGSFATAKQTNAQ
jgi:hypothetical protein